jgi:hypothetical protein
MYQSHIFFKHDFRITHRTVGIINGYGSSPHFTTRAKPTLFAANRLQYSTDPLLTMQHTPYIGLSIHTPSITAVKTANGKEVPWNPIKQDLHQAEPIPVAMRLRRGFVAAQLLGLLGLWVRIPSGTCMSVSCECCVLSCRGLCVRLITLP